MASAGEIMTTNIVAARPDMLVRDVAKLLLDHAISAVPVIDDAGKLRGVVSDGDLISRSAERREKSRAWWLEMLADGFELAPRFVHYLRAHGPRAADVMTHDLITASPETPAEMIARTHRAAPDQARAGGPRRQAHRHRQPCRTRPHDSRFGPAGGGSKR